MKTGFNDADRYLVERWPDALDFERGMEAVRQKYKTIFESLQEELKKQEWYGDDFKISLGLAWGEIGIGRKSWDITQNDYTFPGLYLGGLSLDSLLSESEPLPTACLWVAPVKKGGPDVDDVGKKINVAASKILKGFPQRSGEDSDTIVSFTFPEDRSVLIKGLLEDGGRPFVKIVIAQANRLAELIPAIDSVLGSLLASSK